MADDFADLLARVRAGDFAATELESFRF